MKTLPWLNFSKNKITDLSLLTELTDRKQTKIKGIKKSQKLYLWDWSQIDDPVFRFEKMIASHLLKPCDYWQDVHGHKAELRYIRDEKGKEVDFVVLRDRKQLFAVECKLSDTDAAPALLEFKTRLDIL